MSIPFNSQVPFIIFSHLVLLCTYCSPNAIANGGLKRDVLLRVGILDSLNVWWSLALPGSVHSSFHLSCDKHSRTCDPHNLSRDPGLSGERYADNLREAERAPGGDQSAAWPHIEQHVATGRHYSYV